VGSPPRQSPVISPTDLVGAVTHRVRRSGLAQTTHGWFTQTTTDRTGPSVGLGLPSERSAGDRMGATELAVKLTSQAGGAVLSAHGVVGTAGIIEALLGELLQLQADQEIVLTRVDRNVQQLIEGPWETARIYIEEASLATCPRDRRRARISDASHELRKAIPLQPPRTFARAIVCLDLALVLHILDESDASALHAREAAQNAANYVSDLAAGTAIAPLIQELNPSRVQRENLKHAAKHLVRAKPVSAALNGWGWMAELDEQLNSWLSEIYSALDQIGQAAAVLCGGNDTVVSAALHGVPRNLTARFVSITEEGSRRDRAGALLDRSGFWRVSREPRSKTQDRRNKMFQRRR
jgi:hypothetical protein